MADQSPHIEGVLCDCPEPCDYCKTPPRHGFRYGVRDADGKIVWEGGCRDCAYMVARTVDGSVVARV